jgi:hypothetical protein
MSEDELASPGPGAGPGAGPNRNFILLLAGLGIPLVAAFLIFLFVVLPKIGGGGTPVNSQATETAMAGQQRTAVVISQLTQQAGKVTSRPATATRSPSQTPRPTIAPPTARAVTAAPTLTETPVVSGRETATPLGTRGSGGFVTPTPEGSLSPTGVSGETGGPLIILAGFGLLLVLVVARRLRSA